MCLILFHFFFNKQTTELDKMTEAKQVETIVQYFKKTTSLPKLKNVIIVVSGDPALSHAAELLNIGQFKIISWNINKLTLIQYDC